jgi:hypothetical protein
MYKSTGLPSSLSIPVIGFSLLATKTIKAIHQRYLCLSLIVSLEKKEKKII